MTGYSRGPAYGCAGFGERSADALGGVRCWLTSAQRAMRQREGEVPDALGLSETACVALLPDVDARMSQAVTTTGRVVLLIGGYTPSWATAAAASISGLQPRTDVVGGYTLFFEGPKANADSPVVPLPSGGRCPRAPTLESGRGVFSRWTATGRSFSRLIGRQPGGWRMAGHALATSLSLNVPWPSGTSTATAMSADTCR